MNLLVRLMCISALAPGAVATMAAPGRYEMIPLGEVLRPFTDTAALGINSSGEICGEGMLDGQVHAFAYSHGVLNDLGFLGGIFSEAYSINDSGDLAVGWQSADSSECEDLLLSREGAKRLGGIPGAFMDTMAINSRGDVVGWGQYDETVGQFGFAAIDGNYQFFGDKMPVGIDDDGDIAGTLEYPRTVDGERITTKHAYLYSRGVYQDVSLLLGDPAINSEAHGMNNQGDVVGWFNRPRGRLHSFLYSKGKVTILGTGGYQGSIAEAINDNGLIVGSLVLSSDPLRLGVFFSQNGQLENLADLVDGHLRDWGYMRVYGINDDGWIVGFGEYKNQSQAFLAKPI